GAGRGTSPPARSTDGYATWHPRNRASRRNANVAIQRSLPASFVCPCCLKFGGGSMWISLAGLDRSAASPALTTVPGTGRGARPRAPELFDPQRNEHSAGDTEHGEASQCPAA